MSFSRGCFKKIITDYFNISIQIAEVSATELKFSNSNLLNMYVGKNSLELLLELESMQTQLTNKHPPTPTPPPQTKWNRIKSTESEQIQ